MRGKRRGLVIGLLGVGCATAHPSDIFSIGTQDSSITEFVRAGEKVPAPIYRVGVSSPGADWPQYQACSFDARVTRSTMQEDWVTTPPAADPVPRRIAFTLPTTPTGAFVLHLDALVRHRHPASPSITLFVNGRAAASFRMNPHPASSLWWPNGGDASGNTQYFGYESLDMPLPARVFSRGANEIALGCSDGFGFFYDDISLSNDPGHVLPAVTQAFVEPTVLFKSRAGGLVELATVRVRSTRPLGSVKLKTVVGSESIETSVSQREAGDIEATIEVPAIEQPVPVALYVADDTEPVYRGTFTPRRRWQVYALAMEQADFGYNDLPARTLEWENRFIDKTIKIQQRFPGYAFTLDASANLESYLATRDDTHARQLLDLLRSGKWGINALYANFFTGLSTPEELYRTLDFSLGAARKYGFTVDSASQTDEPSVTWALPQILADAGIKYFVNGSDPIRGALNPIGLLNFHSPFYWEAATGAKVLVWSGVSYTAIDDMTWAGWSPQRSKNPVYSPSTFGLTRSLPLFLSQYERADFPFDAVLLFGLHNDEIPMRHWGDADVIAEWNRQYAYPKVIPATQRDFFRHITEKFPGDIKTFKGDGGAYWEDEAGADARIASMIRTSQAQMVAAEKFENIAGWLQPHLKADRMAYDVAWKNILLANSYVWSDANSFRRPESARTVAGEAAHRAWAEAAFQQSSDLLLVAMDKVADNIDSKRQGAVVFNSESWPRSGLFDFELEHDEVLTDPATGHIIPCGVIQSFGEYSSVRCWAADVPATGYRFYATGKGRTPAGRALGLDPGAPAIENEHYRLELDPETGAVAHLTDKVTGRELVDVDAGYRMNEYLYVTGGDPGTLIAGDPTDNRILAADVTLPLPELRIHHPSLTAAPVARRFAWGTELTVRSKSVNTPQVVSTITLLDLKKRIEIRNDVQKTATLSKEGVYFAFPFRLRTPHIWYQGATAWVNPEIDMLPGANRQWFTTQGGIWGKGDEGDVAWTSVDAPLVTLQDINRGLWPESIRIQSGTVLSYAMNNYWYTDTPARQGGQFTFRYALTSGPDLSPAEAMMLTSEQRSRLRAVRRYNMGWPPRLPATGTGFLQTSPAGVTVVTVRRLDAGDTYLLRVQNTTPADVTAILSSPVVDLRESYLSSPSGDRTGDVSLTQHEIEFPLGRYEIKSVVIRINPKRDQPASEGE